MSKIYTNKNKIKFTEISEKYKVNKAVKGKLSQLHSLLITYVASHFRDTRKYRQKVVYALNVITYFVYSGDTLPFDWSVASPFTKLPDITEDQLEDVLGDLMLTEDGIEWDVDVSDFNVESKDVEPAEDTSSEDTSSAVLQSNSVSRKENNTSKEIKEEEVKEVLPSCLATPKQDLYIQSPSIPQFDYNKPWMRGTDGADSLVIYTTLPEIPTKQNEISVTTDITKMTYNELMNLYPNHIIHTRSAVMYQPCNDIELDRDIGLILPVEGFSGDQLVDNIIQYPHIFKLSREVDGKLVSMYSHIEIEGELYPTLDVWNDLPESRVIPRQSEFVKEYVVRRYLLERDIKHIKHKYPIFGSLDPFLTLFMPPTDYINRGYTDVEDIVKRCVLSRISYKQSRNPVIRRLSNNAELHI